MPFEWTSMCAWLSIVHILSENHSSLQCQWNLAFWLLVKPQLSQPGRTLRSHSMPASPNISRITQTHQHIACLQIGHWMAPARAISPRHGHWVLSTPSGSTSHQGALPPFAAWEGGRGLGFWSRNRLAWPLNFTASLTQILEVLEAQGKRRWILWLHHVLRHLAAN